MDYGKAKKPMEDPKHREYRTSSTENAAFKCHDNTLRDCDFERPKIPLLDLGHGQVRAEKSNPDQSQVEEFQK